MAGIDAVPCASASRRPPGSLLAWNNFFPTWVSLTPSGHTVRSCGTCPGRSCGTCPGRPCGTCPGRRPAALALAGALRHLPWPAPCGTCPGRRPAALALAGGALRHLPCGPCGPCGTCPGRRPAALALAGALRHLPWPAPCGTCPGRRPAALALAGALRHAKRNFFVRQHRLFDTPAPQPVAGRRHLPKRCFGSGCARPVATRTPALFAGIDAVPCASAPRRAGAKTPMQIIGIKSEYYGTNRGSRL